MASHEDIAKHLFLSPQAVGQMVRAGRLPTTGGRGGLDPDACREAYVRRLRNAAAGRGSEDGSELTLERTRLAREQADAQAMRNAALRRELLPAAEVEATWAGILRGVRARMLAVPSRVRQRLPHLTAGEVAAIDREIRDALVELGEGVPAPVDADPPAGAAQD
jgi:phage terminase Nu1 subunit (DNA packaging protein)